MPDDTWSIQGPHLLNCNCEYGCPCQFWGRPTDGTCRAMLAWRIDEGHHGDVRLDGLFAINTYAWPGPIHEGNGSMQSIIDARATDPKRRALVAILQGEGAEPGAVMFQIYRTTCVTAHDPGTVKTVSPVGTPVVSAEHAPTPTPRSDFAAAVASVVDRSVAPTIVARGGAVRVVGASDGVVTLEASGSPGGGAPDPRTHRVAVARRRARGHRGARGVAERRAGRRHRTGRGHRPPSPSARRHSEPRDRRPPGRVVVVDLIDGRASIRLEGGCQGCSLAEVTVRQGIERLVRAHCPEVIAVIDVTDHSAGTEPFYTPDKR